MPPFSEPQTDCLGALRQQQELTKSALKAADDALAMVESRDEEIQRLRAILTELVEVGIKASEVLKGPKDAPEEMFR
jgi:hypothetical protein